MTNVEVRHARPAGKADAPEPGPAAHRGFRPDIEGLRAVAIGTVLLFHAGVSFVPGGFIGVDIFFVISGFLITGLLVREVERSGRVSLSRFYARRARRLLPASALTLSVTALLSWIFMSFVDWRQVGGDIMSASLYVVNWRLAGQAVDYLAEGQAASPVQHFWSLAVEEQFYIVWPLVLLVVAWIARRRGLRVRPLMGIGLAIIVVPSLAFSVVETANHPAAAYFVTTTRLWELGVGGLVAVGAGLWTRLPRTVGFAVGWAGLATLVLGALLLRSTTPWPSAWALVPTLGAAAVIVGGAGAITGANRLLTWRPFVWIGGISYSLYLWHWPLLVIAGAAWGELGAKKSLLVVAVSFIPAYLSLKLVENPFRRSRRISESTGLTLSLAVNLTAAGVVAGLLLILAVPSSGTAGAAAGPVGAASLTVTSASTPSRSATVAPTVDGVKVVDSVPSMTPMPQDATDDVPSAYGRGCQTDVDSDKVTYCDYGDPKGTVDMVVAGDSKMLQWADVLDRIGKAEHWKIRTVTKSACGFSSAVLSQAGKPYDTCTSWNKQVLADVLADKPDVLLVSQGAKFGTAPDGTTGKAGLAEGLATSWEAVQKNGTQVIALLDNPTPQMPEKDAEVYKCVADHLDDLSACAFGRKAGLAASGAPAMEAAAEQVKGVKVLDMTNVFCNDSKCPAVIGGALVYRQGSHLTDTYALSLEDVLRRALTPLVDAAARTGR
ncbi:acyltransferase family protein [Luteimicrobium subarcticum]|uniref:Peptidoglycan/LPS O-acetylase OafA/YrhL n=1 Tax=Luteimicrobium subarcticum TaxID=620910 RepID=A0A2M8WTP1_9MICO|nr:acyltransferase family protein [Luteimicrobium subarcticum]PJI94259.1 peptidoglycan/LPS O-acetylase OafA/YrhL [Luteimicrobium subarcticum]